MMSKANGAPAYDAKASKVPKRPVTARGLTSPYAPLPPTDLLTITIGIFFQIYTILIEPVLCRLHLTSPGGPDPTYGRKDVPHNDWEKQMVYDNPEVKFRRGRVPLLSSALAKSGSWDRPHKRSGESFVSYTVFWMPTAMEKCGFKADVLLLHGINDYCGKLVPHGYHFAKSGFRVIVIDLPSFGRSSGLHAYLPSMRLLVEATHAVLYDIKDFDSAEAKDIKADSEERRKLFLEGHSMGGFTALYYVATYPPAAEEEVQKGHLVGKNWRPQVDGVAVAAPMIGISPQSRPSYPVELIARFLRFFVGRLPLATAVRGNVSDDPRVEEEFHLDPMTYKGRLRIATGLAVLEGLQDLQSTKSQITCPVAIHHGTHDRATSHLSSRAFYDELPPNDKSVFRAWDGYEHVMMKNVKGQSREDDEKRDAVLGEITQWLIDRARD